MRKVFVKGWIEDVQLDPDAVRYHSMPVRFKCEDGGYEWVWVRKNNVTMCETRRKPRRK